jgi:hypothetical protein
VTLRARIVDHFALALAGGAGLPQLEETLRTDDLAVAVAGGAALLLGAGLGSGAAAVRAGLGALDLDRAAHAGRDFLERELEVDLEARAAPAAAPAAAAEELFEEAAAAAAEQVAERGEDVLGRSEATTLDAVDGRMAVLVVTLPPLRGR